MKNQSFFFLKNDDKSTCKSTCNLKRYTQSQSRKNSDYFTLPSAEFRGSAGWNHACLHNHVFNAKFENKPKWKTLHNFDFS